MPPPLNLVGKRFGKWTVLKKVPSTKKNTYWLCQCDCGNTKIHRGGNLTFGDTSQCFDCRSKTNAENKIVNISGKKFGKWTVIKLNGRNKSGQIAWLCRCECGNKKDITYNALHLKSTTQCRKCGYKQVGEKTRLQLTGEVFGKLTVVKLDPNINRPPYKWICKCSCGNTTSVIGSSLRDGSTKSCGCLSSDVRSLDLRGKIFGKLTAIKIVENYAKNSNNTNNYWQCKCSCGNLHTTQATKLVHGRCTQCKKCASEATGLKQFKDLSGQKHGFYTFLSFSHRAKNNSAVWNCRCICGTVKNVRADSILYGEVISCGCMKKRLTSVSSTLFLDSLEKIVKKPIEREFYLGHRFFDGQIGKVLIEVDCSYWHNFEDAKRNDKKKNLIASKNGYKLFRFKVENINDVPRKLKYYRDKIQELNCMV